MAEDFFWRIKKDIERDLASFSTTISQLKEEDLTDGVYSRLSRQAAHIQDLFDQISEVNKDLDLTQSNPQLFQLLEAKRDLNRLYGQFNRQQSIFFKRFAKTRGDREEELQRDRAVPDEPFDAPDTDAVSWPEEESEEIEEEAPDPEAEKRAKQAERAARQKRLAEEARKRERYYDEQRRRQEEAQKLGVNVQPGQSVSDADLYRERLRQEDARYQEQLQRENRIRDENEALRRTRERLQHSEQYERLSGSHIDMAKEGFGYKKEEYSQSPSYTSYEFTPSGVAPVVTNSYQSWDTGATNNDAIYNTVVANRSGTASEPIPVSSAIETQMRFNLDRARLACQDAYGTDAAPAAVHEYIQQRNALSRYRSAIEHGAIRVEDRSIPTSFDTSPSGPSNRRDPNYVGSFNTFTPDGTVKQTVENGYLTGNSYEFSHPSPSAKPAYSRANPMYVSPQYEEEITNQMRRATEVFNSAIARGETQSVDAHQLKLYTDAYLGFQAAKREGSVIVTSDSNSAHIPDYRDWQQRRQAASGAGNSFGTTGQTKDVNPGQVTKKSVEDEVANIFNQTTHLKRESLAKIYAGQVGDRFKNYSYGAMGAFSRQIYYVAQSGDDNAIRTMESGRYYITAATGVVMAMQSGSPTKALAQGVAHAHDKEFSLYGTKSLLTNQQLGSVVNDNLRISREVGSQISELEKKLTPMIDKMEQYLREHPGAKKLDGLDKYSQREYEKLSTELKQLQAAKKRADKSLSMHQDMQAMRHQTELEAEFLNSLKKNGKMPGNAKQFERAAEKFLEDKKEELLKKYGDLAKSTRESVVQELSLLKSQARQLKEQILLLQQKGQALTQAEKQLLEQLKAQAKKLTKDIQNYTHLSKDLGDLEFLRMKKESLLNGFYKNRSRYVGGLYAIQSFMLKALEAGYDSNTDGIAKAIRLVSNRHVRKLLKKSFKAAMTMSKAGLNLMVPNSVETLSNAMYIAKMGIKANVGAATQTIKGAVNSGIKLSLNAARRGISSALPTGIKTGIKSGIRTAVNAANAITGKYNAVATGIKNAAFRAKNWFADTRLGRGISAIRRFNTKAAQAISKALSFLKGIALKALLYFLAVFLLIGFLSMAFAGTFSIVSSTIAAPNESEDGRIDLSPYVSILMAKEHEFQRKIGAIENDSKYDKVTVNYTGPVNNIKHILSMMAVRLEQDLDIERDKKIERYLQGLYNDSHTYTVTERDYSCSGCKEKEEQKYIIDSRTGRKIPVTKWDPETGKHVPVMVTVKYCPGHTEAIVKISVLTFDDIFEVDSSSFGAVSLVGTEIKEKVWNFLKDKGLKDTQAAAIMGNIEGESSFNPDLIEIGSGAGYGLCQWTGGRRTQYESYARSKGKDPADLATQLEFFWLEFDPSSDSSFASNQWIVSDYSYEAFMAAKTVEEATSIFCYGWERPGIPRISTRVHAALFYYSLYAGTDSSDYEKPEQETDAEADANEEAEKKVFKWDENNREWCKHIFNMPWKDLYDGVYDYGGVIETGELIVKGDYMWPVTSTNIASYFGYRDAPTEGASTYHKGVDISIPTGTPVHAVADGIVTTSTFGSSGGNYIIIDHGNGIVTRYLHNNILCFDVGDEVKQGDVIAYSGNTGISTGPHLHFEFIVNGTPIDPCLQFEIY